MKPTATHDTVTLELDLRHSPARVWRTLIDPVLLSEWLLPIAALEATPGRRFQFKAPPQPGWDGTVDCQMLEVEPERKIRWSWVVGDLDTTVTFVLTPTPTGTHLSVAHTGFLPHQKQNLGGARYGWNMMSERLIALLASLP